MMPRQQQKRPNHSTARSFVPSSSKVHKTRSSPSVLRMMESGSDPFQKADCDEDEAMKRKSLVFESDASDSGVTSGEAAAPSEEAAAPVEAAGPGEADAPSEAVLCPVIKSADSGEEAELGCSRGTLPASDNASAVETPVETPKLSLSSPKLSPPVQLSLKEEEENDDKENKGDVFATPFGSADASEVPGGAEGGEGGGVGFASILKSFWKRTSWTWDDQEKQHCGDKEEAEEEGDAAAGSESKQTDVEADMNDGGELQVGYKRRVQEVTQDAPEDALPAGGSSEAVGGGDVHEAPEAVTTAAVNNSSRMPGECCRRCS